MFDHVEVPKHTLIYPSEFCGEGNYIDEDVSKLYCPEDREPYPEFWLDENPVCPNGPNTTDPQGDGTFPEHIVP